MTTILDTRSLFPLLAGHQERVLGILEGLDEERLRRPVLPSGWSCLGMVQHLRLMTRFWFADVMTGRLSAYPDDEFAVDHDQPGSDALDASRSRPQRRAPASRTCRWTPRRRGGRRGSGATGGWRLDSLFEVVQHVLVETACHAGHLDAARELLDGRTWDYAAGRLAEPR